MRPPSDCDRGRFAQRQVERVDMPAAAVEQAADVALAGHAAADRLAIQQLQLGVAVALPERFLRSPGGASVYR